MSALDEVGAADEPDLAAEMARLFIEEAPPLLAAMREAIRNGDHGKLQSAAHALKGCGSSLGARRLSALSLELEQQGRAHSTSGATEKLDQLERELTRVCGALRELHGASGATTALEALRAARARVRANVNALCSAAAFRLQ